MSAFLEALKAAALLGHYIPEIELVYDKYDDFRYAKARALDFGH